MANVGLAAIQREQNNADQYYVRGRNVVTASSVVFFGAQALLVAMLGQTEKDSRGDAVLRIAGTALDLTVSFAIGSVIFLVLTAVVVFTGQDRARAVRVIDAKTLNAWPPRADSKGPILRIKSASGYVRFLVEGELAAWDKSNRLRRTDTRVVSVLGAISALFALFQILTIYVAILT